MATQYHRKFALEILTPTGPVVKMDAFSVIFPAADGEMGILGGRSPLVASLGAGVLTAYGLDDKVERFYVAGGFAEVHEDTMTVLAEEGTPVAKVDGAKATAELQAAESMPQDTVEQRNRRNRAVKTARAKVEIAQQVQQQKGK